MCSPALHQTQCGASVAKMSTSSPQGNGQRGIHSNPYPFGAHVSRLPHGGEAILLIKSIIILESQLLHHVLSSLPIWEGREARRRQRGDRSLPHPPHPRSDLPRLSQLVFPHADHAPALPPQFPVHDFLLPELCFGCILTSPKQQIDRWES